MRTAMKGIAIGLVSLASTTHAAAQSEPPLSLILTCGGTDTEIRSRTVTTDVSKDFKVGEGATAQSTSREIVRVPARMSVKILDGVLRFRPPETSQPLLKRPADGWYEATNLEVTATQILARAPYGGMLSGKYRLTIDRQTGDIDFGDFHGGCERAVDTPTARKF